MNLIKYPKTQTMFKRDEQKIIMPEWTYPEIEYLRNLEWIFTEKVDGTNIRLVYDPEANGFDMRGRTDDALHSELLTDTITGQYGSNSFIHKVLSVFPRGAILFGEGYGKGYNGNYRQDGCDFVLFDVYVPAKSTPGIRAESWWLTHDNIEAVGRDLEIPVVPRRGSGTLYEAIHLVSSEMQSLWGDFEAEGLICAPKQQLFNRKGERIKVKVKAKDFRGYELRHKAQFVAP